VTLWSPWAARSRPTTSTLTDDDLDDILGRLEAAEWLSRTLVQRFWPDPGQRADQLGKDLFVAFRGVLHREHPSGSRFGSMRTEERCRLCIMQAHHLVRVWEATQAWEPSATETRLAEIQDRITQSPRTSWADSESAWRSREDVPWLLSQLRLLQRTVRRMQARENREDKDERKYEQRIRDLRIRNRQLAEEIKQSKILNSTGE
jgi:hypothetical protein